MVNHSHGYAHNNQGTTTIGGHAQSTQGTHLEYSAQVTKDTVALGPTGHLLYKEALQRLGDIAA